MKNILAFIVFSTLSLSSLAVVSASDIKWREAYVKKGITVYRPTRVFKEGVAPLKSSTILNYSPSRVLQAIADSSRKHEWVPKMQKSKLIEWKSATSLVDHNFYNSPWPVTDREFLVSIDFSYKKKLDQIFIEITSTEHPKANTSEDYIRGICHYGMFTIRPIENGTKSLVDITYIVDPMGSIPTWLVNFVQRSWPYNYMRNLSEHLAKDDLVVAKKWKNWRKTLR